MVALRPRRLAVSLLVAAAIAAAAALVLRAPGGAPEPLAAYAMVVAGGDEQQRSEPPVGEVEIALVIGRPGAMPPDLEAALRDDPAGRWTLHRRTLLLAESAAAPRAGNGD